MKSKLDGKDPKYHEALPKEQVRLPRDLFLPDSGIDSKTSSTRLVEMEGTLTLFHVSPTPQQLMRHMADGFQTLIDSYEAISKLIKKIETRHANIDISLTHSEVVTAFGAIFRLAEFIDPETMPQHSGASEDLDYLMSTFNMGMSSLILYGKLSEYFVY